MNIPSGKPFEFISFALHDVAVFVEPFFHLPHPLLEAGVLGPECVLGGAAIDNLSYLC